MSSKHDSDAAGVCVAVGYDDQEMLVCVKLTANRLGKRDGINAYFEPDEARQFIDDLSTALAAVETAAAKRGAS